MYVNTPDYELPSGLTPEEYLELDDIDDTAPSGLELHLDLDYVVRRIEFLGPLFPTYRYWVSPATLIFGAVSGLSGDPVSVHLPLDDGSAPAYPGGTAGRDALAHRG